MQLSWCCSQCCSKMAADCTALHQKKKKSIASKMVSDFNKPGAKKKTIELNNYRFQSIKPGAKTIELKWLLITPISLTKE